MIKVMFDTDMGSDCDDAGALALLHELATLGECEILSVTHCHKGKGCGGCLAAINTYYGRPDIPTGAFSETSIARKDPTDIYTEAVADKYFDGTVKIEETTAVMRRTLAKAEDGEVTLVAVGTFNSLRALLESKADEISPLDGLSLVKKKVARAVVMAGGFTDVPPRPEFNVKTDIPSAKIVCDNWPTELIFSPHEIGVDIYTAKRFQNEGSDKNPAVFAYRHWNDVAYGENSGKSGRASWDLVTVLHAVRPENGLWKLHEYGKVDVDDEGVTTWKADCNGKHTYLMKYAADTEAEEIIDGLLCADVERSK